MKVTALSVAELRQRLTIFNAFCADNGIERVDELEARLQEERDREIENQIDNLLERRN